MDSSQNSIKTSDIAFNIRLKDFSLDNLALLEIKSTDDCGNNEDNQSYDEEE